MSHPTGHVLVVDDDPAYRQAARAFLEELGYTSREASDGEKALAILENGEAGEIDLLMTDLVMPGMGGLELATEWRFHRPDTALLFISGYANDIVILNRGLQENSFFLHKPFGLDDLRSALDQLAPVGS